MKIEKLRKKLCKEAQTKQEIEKERLDKLYANVFYLKYLAEMIKGRTSSNLDEISEDSESSDHSND